MPVCSGAPLAAKPRWDAKQYFAARDAEWKATVSVGALEASKSPATAPALSQSVQH